MSKLLTTETLEKRLKRWPHYEIDLRGIIRPKGQYVTICKILLGNVSECIIMYSYD